MNELIYSVSQLNQTARSILEGKLGSIWLTGEISNFSQPVSGHWYLTLKDENSQVRCAMFRMKNLRVTFHPQNGIQVLVRACVSLYEPRGDYQLIIDSMHPAGEGLLQKSFEDLKLKLATEGLFAQNLKKNLPHFSRKIGIITSKTSAALQDMLQILARRDPSLGIIIYPTAVQGNDAAEEIVEMIALANKRQEVDVLIVGRGGGPLEDLWCFNEEIVARAIFHSTIPIISAVGHETDVTIADFVADLRAPTPSAAAELVSRNQAELSKQIQYQQERLTMALDRFFYTKQQQLQHWQLHLQNQHPQHQLRSLQQRITQYCSRLTRDLNRLSYSKRQQLQHLNLRLRHQHPQRQIHSQQQQIAQCQMHLEQAIQRTVEKHSQKYTALLQRLIQTPLPYQIRQQSQCIEKQQTRLNFALNKLYVQKQNQFQRLCGKIDSLSPLKVLSRGYSITENAQGQVIKTPQQVSIGEILKTRISSKDIITSKIIQIQ